MKINLTNLFKQQLKLDKHIHSQHNVNYAKIHTELKLALIVELAETANEIRSFKFWSNKPMSTKDIVLEEYVDGIHFITSLCIYYKVKPIFNVAKQVRFKSKREITKSFISLLNNAALIDSPSKAKMWYSKYLTFGLKMGFSITEILKSYDAKNKINHQRQDNNY